MPSKIQVAAAFDTDFVRDHFVNTLYFEDLGTADWDGTCADVAELFDNAWYSSSTPQIEATAYSVGTDPPYFPKGYAIRNQGLHGTSGGPREIALCLSFFSERNLPRQRGRIYLSPMGTGQGFSDPRPATSLMNKALDLADGIAAIGGVDVDWQVYSKTDGEGRDVTNAWVDNEWDTMRSRGLRGDTRVQRAVGA